MNDPSSNRLTLILRSALVGLARGRREFQPAFSRIRGIGCTWRPKSAEYYDARDHSRRVGRLLENSGPAATRTRNLLLRRQLLYPAELRAHESNLTCYLFSLFLTNKISHRRYRILFKIVFQTILLRIITLFRYVFKWRSLF